MKRKEMQKREASEEVTFIGEEGELLYRLIPDKSYYSSGLFTVDGVESDYTHRTPLNAAYIDMLFGTGKVQGEFTIPFTSDDATKNLLVGMTGDAASRQALLCIEKDEWIICQIDGKVVVNGWFDNSVAAAARELYKQIVEKGRKSLTLPVIGTVTGGKYNTDIPNLAAGTFQGGLDADDGTLMLRYTDVDTDDFAAYAKALEADGYILYQENLLDNYKEAKNLFRTYIKDDKLVHISFLPADLLTADRMELSERYRYYRDGCFRSDGDEIRIVTDFVEHVLPNEEANVWTDAGIEPKMTVVNLYDQYEDGNDIGACVIFTLSDGSFLIQDGGGNRDMDQLYKALCRLNERKDGEIVVAAWILTHAHVDHTGALHALANSDYASEITIERIMFRKAAETYSWRFAHDKYAGSHTWCGEPLNDEYMKTILKNFKNGDGTQILHPHMGQRMYVRDARVDILYAGNEDLFPVHMGNFNDTSLVVKVNLGGEDILLLADACRESESSVLMPLFSEALKCDILQVPHHGLGGPTNRIYDTPYLRPGVVIWNTTWRTIEKNAFLDGKHGTSGKTQYGTEKDWMNPGWKLNLVADEYAQTIILPFDPDTDSVIKTED